LKIQRLRRVGLVVVLLLLGACSSTTFVYNRLDIILPWYLGDYVDLTRDQKTSLKSLLQPYLAWHRQEELPQYLQMLEDLETDLDRTVTVADMDAIVERFESGWLRLESRTLDWMLELGESLSDEQIAEFIDALRKQQAEYGEEYLERSDEEYREEAAESLEDSAKKYLGRLDWGQRSALGTAAASLQRLDDAWLAERADWLDRMELLLQREPGWQQDFRLMLEQRDQTVQPEYQLIYDNNVRAVKQAIVTVLNGRSEKQDKRLRKKLSALQKDLSTLIEQA
jgi:hypothetical protein